MSPLRTSIRGMSIRGIGALLFLATLMSAPAVLAASAGITEQVFRGDPIHVQLEPGRLTELVFPRTVIDVASGDEVIVRHLEGDSILYLRPAKPRFDTSIFVRLDGGYSVPLVISRGSAARPTTISLSLRIDPTVRASRDLVAAHQGPAPASKTSSTFSETDLIRAMFRGEKLAGYSILEENGRVDLETPQVTMRRIRTWVSPVWEGLLVEVTNRTDELLEIEPLSFQGQGKQAPRMIYLYDDRLAPRPRRASDVAVSAHKTHALIVRPAAKAGATGRVPRSGGGGA